jgi:outer membrane protein
MIRGARLASRRLLAGLAVVTVADWCSAGAETLTDAWQLALARDKSLAAAQSDVQGAQAAERAARGARWPSLDANATYARLNASPAFDIATPAGVTFRSGPLFKADEVVAGSVQMKLSLYAGGQISAGIDAAQRTAAGASAEEEAVRSLLKLDVAEAYVDVLRERRALEAASSSVESLAAHARDVRHMAERDLVPKSDLLAAGVALANAEQDKVRAANSVQVAQATYNRRLGEPLERSLELDEQIPADMLLKATPVDTLIRRALASRREIVAQAARADALAAQAQAESGKVLPQFALIGGYTHFDNQFLDRQDFSAIGIGFTWSLFDGGQARNRAAALRSASHAAENRAADLRSQIELQVRQAWLGAQEAEARSKATGEAVAQAEENLRSSRELYSAGLATNTQVLDAVTLQINAVANRNNATLDESLSLLRLEYAVGEL